MKGLWQFPAQRDSVSTTYHKRNREEAIPVLPPIFTHSCDPFTEYSENTVSPGQLLYMCLVLHVLCCVFEGRGCISCSHDFSTLTCCSLVLYGRSVTILLADNDEQTKH